MILLITYDLRLPGKNYDALYEAIKGAPAWWHYLESTWVVSTGESVTVWQDRLLSKIDSNDHLFVVDITKAQRGGWLPKKAWEWLSNKEGA